MQSLRRFASPRPSEGVAVIVRPQALARLPRAGGPQLSNAAGQLLRQIRVSDEYGDEHAIQVPVERPLSVLVDGRPVATLWTLGACPESLVLGYLWHQQLVTDRHAPGVDPCRLANVDRTSALSSAMRRQVATSATPAASASTRFPVVPPEI